MASFIKCFHFQEEEGDVSTTMRNAYDAMKNADSVIEKVKSLRSLASMTAANIDLDKVCPDYFIR